MNIPKLLIKFIANKETELSMWFIIKLYIPVGGIKPIKYLCMKKLCISLIFNKLKETKLLIYIHRMHNLYAIFAKFLNICKQVAGNLVNE